MTDEQLKQELISMLNISRGSLIKRLRDGTLPELAEFILRKTAFMDDAVHKGFKYPWLYRIYCVIHDMTGFPKCNNPNCENKIDKVSGFLGEKRGFRPYCSNKCSQSAPDVIRHRAETCMAECGVTNKSKLKEVIEKGHATRIKNSTSQSVTNEKARQTRYKKNNGKWHAEDFGEKVKAGKIKNGHPPNWNNPEKRTETLQEAYNVNNTFNLPQVRKSSTLAIRRKSYDKHIVGCQYDEPLFTFDEYFNRYDDNVIFKFKCKKCGTVFESAHRDGHHRRCPECYPKLEGQSGEELELRDFVSSSLPNETIVFGSRSVIYPKELDIYIPNMKLAIEFNGLFWHCFDKKHEWEMLRFCSRLGYHIPGAAGKLLKYFERNYNPKSLVSYADRRWSTGKLYMALGFDLKGLSSPNYWYVNNSIRRYSRIEFQKHKLKHKLKVFDKNKTEVENMKANGYYRIFDCGNMVFEKKYNHEST